MSVRRAAAACALLSLGACTDRDPMTRQPRADAYRAEPFFEDGRAMRPLVADTMAREQYEQQGSLRAVRLTDGGFEDAVPLPITAELLERGREQYDIVCATCHGVRGDGDTPVARKMTLRAPPPLVSDGEGPRFSKGHLFAVMTNGYGLMPSYKGQLAPDDRWAIVAYLDALALSAHAPLSMVPDAVKEGER